MRVLHAATRAATRPACGIRPARATRSHIGGLPNGFQGGNAAAGCPAPATRVPAAGGCTLNAAVVERRPAALGVQPVARPDPLRGAALRHARLRPGRRPRPARTRAASAPIAPARAPAAIGGDGQLGTKNGDAAIVEKYSEEGATLLKNDGNALPLTASDLAGGILVTGSSANHTVADPTNEASTGFIDRDAVNPLQQLKQFSGNPNAFTFVPGQRPGRRAIPSSCSRRHRRVARPAPNLSVDGGAADCKDTHAIDHSARHGEPARAGRTRTPGRATCTSDSTRTRSRSSRASSLPAAKAVRRRSSSATSAVGHRR